MRNEVDRETRAGVLLFSTISLRPVKQKFDLVQSTPETACEVRNSLSVSFERCYRSVEDLNFLLRLKFACVLSSYLKMKEEIFFSLIGEGFLQKAFIMNLFCSAVNTVSFLSLGIFFFAHNKRGHLALNIQS